MLEQSKPAQPAEQEATMVVDTVHFLCAVAYTWNLHTVVEPYLFVVDGNSTDTLVFPLSATADTLRRDHCLYNPIFLYDQSMQLTPNRIKPRDLGYKYCEFAMEFVHPAGQSVIHNIPMFWAYRLKDGHPTDLNRVGAWQTCMYWLDDPTNLHGGTQSLGLTVLPQDQDQVLSRFFHADRVAPYGDELIYICPTPRPLTVRCGQ